VVSENEQPIPQCRLRSPSAFHERGIGGRRQITRAFDAPLRARVRSFAKNKQ
jgi:hypothetical protein